MKKQVIYVDDMLQETNLHYTSAVIFPAIMKMTNSHLSFFSIFMNIDNLKFQTILSLIAKSYIHFD